MAFLEVLSQKRRTDQDDVKSYCREFKIAATHLMDTGQVTTYQYGIWFMRGLPEFLRRKVLADGKVDVTDPKTVVFKDIFDKAMKAWIMHENTKALEYAPAKEEVRDLVESMWSKLVIRREDRMIERVPNREGYAKDKSTPGVDFH